MIIDTSVVIAVLFREFDRSRILKAMASSDLRKMSAVSYMEAGMVLTSHFGNRAEGVLDRFLREADVTVIPVDLGQTKIALEAFRNYGKGRHPAGLNFGDCFSYALAKSVGEPLLFKGVDFSKTDVLVA